MHLHVGKEKITMGTLSDTEDQLLVHIFDKIAVRRGLIRKPELYQFKEYASNNDPDDNVCSAR